MRLDWYWVAGYIRTQQRRESPTIGKRSGHHGSWWAPFYPFWWHKYLDYSAWRQKGISSSQLLLLFQHLASSPTVLIRWVGICEIFLPKLILIVEEMFSTLCGISSLNKVRLIWMQRVAPWIQDRRIDWAKTRYRRNHALHKMYNHISEKQEWGGLFKADGKPNEDALLR